MSTIRITYTTHVEVDLEEVCDELKIRMEHIKTVTATGNVLNIFMVNGSLLHYEFDPAILCDTAMEEQNPTVCIESLSRLYDDV